MFIIQPKNEISQQYNFVNKQMGLFRFLFKWSLEISGSLILGYNYGLKPDQQADLYGFYRSCHNSYRAAKQIYAALNEYKALTSVQTNSQEFKKQLREVNTNTAKRIEELSRINRGVYMRLGQYLGSLKFAFPSQFYEILKDLNEKPNYQPEDYKYLKKHIEAQMGKKTKELFESLNTSPIKTDNFYQVYKGELAENFLDANIKVINPYASSQAKYDFMFLKKAIEYVNSFQQKTFSLSQSYPLYLDLLYSNLKQSVQKEINYIEQQNVIADVKQKLADLVAQQKSKPTGRVFPVYVPHLYTDYTKEKIMIQEYFQGNHFSDSDSLLKENYNKKSIASDLLGIWNTVLEKNKLILQSYTPFDLFVRKSRVNEEGAYQICPLNLGLTEAAPQFLAASYPALWKEFVSSVKINPKKPEERINSIRTFYHNLPQIYFSLFLNNQQKISQLTEKANLPQIGQQNTSKFVEFSKANFSKDISKKIESAKILSASKLKQNGQLSDLELEKYENLRRAFEIEYQPWKIEQLFKTYKEIFREEKNFGLF